jgi:hypothetical protein
MGNRNDDCILVRRRFLTNFASNAIGTGGAERLARYHTDSELMGNLNTVPYLLATEAMF